MAKRIEDLVKLGPDIWPGAALPVQPADMSRFVPMGFGLGDPGVMLPWDRLSDVMTRGNYYGLQPHRNHPLLDAPVTDPGGGIVYFASRTERADFETLLRLMQVYSLDKTYFAFLARAGNPQEDQFLVQLRLISPSAMHLFYSAALTDETQNLVAQTLTVGELLWQFIETQEDEWGLGYSNNLNGIMGGDGDWAKEKLAFGLMVENAYHCVYRIWSRAWLVTK
jgi:hypothetical protein